MPSFFLRPASVLATIVLILPFAASGGGCGSSTACFTFSQGQFAVNGNRCPAQADALLNFRDPKCPGPVVAVNGPGTFDGELCCYPVTYEDITPACGAGMGGSLSTTGSFPPPGPQGVTAVGTGVGGSSTGCASTCDSAFFAAGPPCSGPPLQAYEALQVCAECGGSGAGGSGDAGSDDAGASCALVCQVFCANGAVGGACSTCLTSTCVTQLNACLSL